MTLKAAVIGVGSMGRNHARIYAELPNVDLVGVADEEKGTVETVSHHCATRGYCDYVEMLKTEHPDVVTIAVPTAYHGEVALRAMELGVHVLVEKPIAHTIEQAQTMISASEQYGVLLMVGHVERFNPAVIALKERLNAGDLGRVFQMDARREGPFPDRIKDVGVVIDLAVHDLDVMRYVTGAEVTRVYAETGQCIHTSHEDLLCGLVRFSDGTVGTLSTNWLTPTKIREIFVTGERGMFRVDYLTQDLYFFENPVANGEGWETLRVLRGVGEGRMIRHVVQKKEPLRAELEAFIAAVKGKLPSPVTGMDGLKALVVASACVQSGTDHTVVTLS